MASEPEREPIPEKLSLYCRDWCGACFVVKRAIKRLGLPVEIRDIFRDPRYYDELVAARGRGTVPVLRRDLADGRTEWMPESRDILAFLSNKFAGAVKSPR